MEVGRSLRGLLPVFFSWMVRLKLFPPFSKTEITPLYNFTNFRMVCKNCNAFKNILEGNRAAFMIYGQLIDDKFTLVPNITTIHTTFVNAMENTLNRLKYVPRWLRTTNVLCPFVNNIGTDESHLLYTYYTHVAKCKYLQDKKNECYNSIGEFVYRLQKSSQRYRYIIYLNIKRVCVVDKSQNWPSAHYLKL